MPKSPISRDDEDFGEFLDEEEEEEGVEVDAVSRVGDGGGLSGVGWVWKRPGFWILSIRVLAWRA